MDEKLEKIVGEILPQQMNYRDKLFPRELIVPGLVTVNGKDAKEEIDSKGFSFFMEDGITEIIISQKALDNNPAFSDKEKVLSYFDDFPDIVEEYFQYNISVVRRIISSMEELIPSKLDDSGKKIAMQCNTFSEIMLGALEYAEESLLCALKQNEENSSLNDSKNNQTIKRSILAYSFIELNFLTVNTMWYRQKLYEYYYGPKDNIIEIEKAIKHATDSIVELFSLQLNSIKKDTEQILNSRETKNESLKAIKENQEKIKELVKDRNEMDAEKAGTLSVEECVIIIGLIERKYGELKRCDCESVGIPPETVKMKTEGTIRRNIEFWDQYQNGNKAKGRKPPRKDYSRNMSKEDFMKWYNAIQLDQYNKWKARNRIDAFMGKSTRGFGDE